MRNEKKFTVCFDSTPVFFLQFKAGASKCFPERGHNQYCRLVRGPHASKIQNKWNTSPRKSLAWFLKYYGQSHEDITVCFISQFIEHKRYTLTSFFYVVSHCHLSATLQTISNIVETYRQSSCGSNFYRTFKVFVSFSLVCVYIYRVRQIKCIHNSTKENSTLYNRLL